MEALEHGDMTNAAMFERNLPFLPEWKWNACVTDTHNMLGTENPVPLKNQASENKKESFLQSPLGPHMQAATTDCLPCSYYD